MKMQDVFPNKYLQSSDLEGNDVSVTITGCEIEEMGKDKDRKPVLTFKGTDKKMVLNKTNWSVIGKILGSDETDDWIGKRITLYPTEVESFGETVMAIRVRLKAPKPEAQTAKAGALTAKAALSIANKPEQNGAVDNDDIPF